MLLFYIQLLFVFYFNSNFICFFRKSDVLLLCNSSQQNHFNSSEMITFNFDSAKSIHALLYILNNIGQADMHKIAKILYLADRNLLTRFGNPITGDKYIAMNYGPVPSKIYNIIKDIRDKKDNDYLHFFKVSGKNYETTALCECDLEELSQADIESLNQAINEINVLDFNERVHKTHDSAYKATSLNGIMLFENIAEEGGANPEMIQYIQLVADNTNILG